jgi:hypothetical protein
MFMQILQRWRKRERARAACVIRGRNANSPQRVHIKRAIPLHQQCTFIYCLNWTQCTHSRLKNERRRFMTYFAANSLRSLLLFSLRAACVCMCLLPRASYLMRVSLSLKSWPSCLSPARDYRRSSRDSSPDDRPALCCVHNLCTRFYSRLLSEWNVSDSLSCWIRVSASAACTRKWERWKMDFSTAPSEMRAPSCFAAKKLLHHTDCAFYLRACFCPDC